MTTQQLLTGSLKIRQDGQNRMIVEAKLMNGTLWLTKRQMAQFFGVFVNTIGNNLRSIFKNELLREDDVTRTIEYEDNGKRGFTVFYNLEAIIFVAYRIGSFQAQAFREWVMSALCEYNKTTSEKKPAEVLVVYNVATKTSDIVVN